jgi:hypothetical protein
MIIEEDIKAGTTVQLAVLDNSMSPLQMDGVDEVRHVPCIPTELESGIIFLLRYQRAICTPPYH